MFDPGAIKDELLALKKDMTELVTATGEPIIESVNSHVDSTAEQIKSVLTDLGKILESEESQLEKLIAERPVAALASAFGLGIVIGFLLRRH